MACKLRFKIHEVVVLTGFSKYMLDYLVRERIFSPSDGDNRQPGKARLYTYTDVVLLRALREICYGKGKIIHLKKALAEFRKCYGPIFPDDKITHLLFVNGRELAVFSPEDGLRELRTGQLVFPYVIDLDFVSKSIKAQLLRNTETEEWSLGSIAAAQAEEVRQFHWKKKKKRKLLTG
jgi:hypothetical protein